MSRALCHAMIVFRTRLLVVLLMTLLWANVATVSAAPANSASETLVRGWIARLNAINITTTTGAIETDGARNLVRVKDLKVVLPGVFTTGAITLTAGQLELTAPAEDAGRLSLRAARATQVRWSDGSGGATLEVLELDSVSYADVAGASGSALPPLRTLAMALRRVFGFEVNAARALNLQWNALGGAPDGGRVGRFEVSEVRAGKVSQITLSDVTLGNPDPAKAASAPTSKVEQIVLQGVAPNLIVAAIDPEFSGAVARSGDWMELVKSVSVVGYQRRDPETRTTVSQAALGGLGIRPFDRDSLAILDRAAVDPEFFRKQPDEARKVSDALAVRIRLASLDINGVTVDDGKQPSERASRLGRVQVTGLEPKRADNVAVTEVAIQNGDGALKVARLAVGKIDLVGLPSALPMQGRPAAIPVFESLDFEGLLFVSPGTEVDLKSLRFRGRNHVAGTPTEFTGALEGLNVPVKAIADPSLKAMLTELGLQTVKLEADVGGTWSEPREVFEFDQIRLAIADLGSLKLSGTFGAVARPLFERGFFDEKGDTPVTVRQLRANYVDAGLVSRVLAGMAAANKASSEQLRRGLTSNMPVIFGTIPDASIRNRLVFAAVTFLNDPKSLEISTLLPGPVPLSAVLGAWKDKRETLPILLKIDAVANRKP